MQMTELSPTRRVVEPLTHARGVFFDGGRQWRLADAYLNTLTHRELQNLLNRGGVIGGSFAQRQRANTSRKTKNAFNRIIAPPKPISQDAPRCPRHGHMTVPG